MQFDQPSPLELMEAHVEAIRQEEAEREELKKGAEYYKLKHLSAEEGKRLAEKEAGASRRIRIMPASAVTPQRVRWLWAPGDEGHGRIPLGELTLIVGKGGVGKSTLLAQMAAWITRGDMHGEFYGTPRDVLYVVNEDSLRYTVVPRLMAAGADLGRVHFVNASTLDGGDSGVMLPTDCEAVSEHIRATGAVALFLDPLSSNIKVENTNDGKSVRSVIEAVRRMSEECGIATVGLAHTRKAVSASLMDALMGSSELGNVCRSAMGVMADPDEEGTIVLSQEKSNLGKLNIDSYRYRIDTFIFQAPDGTAISTGQLNFLGKTDVKVSDLLSDSMHNTTGVGEAVKWLREYLEREGPTSRKDVIAAARKDEGLSEHTVKRAADRLKIKSARVPGFQGGTRWALPPHGQ